MNSFDEWVKLFKKENAKIKKDFAHLLFLVVYPDNLKWDFGVEKQTQTTTETQMQKHNKELGNT